MRSGGGSRVGQQVAVREVRGWSPHVIEQLDQLTAQQRAAIPRLVLAIIEGRGVASLLRGPGKVCSHWTYWRKAKPPVHSAGWAHQPRFQRAMAAALDDLRLRTETDVVEESVQRIRARLRRHDEWADATADLGIDAAKRLEDLMMGRTTVEVVAEDGSVSSELLEDPRHARTMVAAAKALNDREGRLYEQDKSRADKLLAEKESAAAADAFLEVMRQGMRAAAGEEGVSADGSWDGDEEVAELGLQDEAVVGIRVLTA